MATLSTNPRISVQQGQEAIEQFLALYLTIVDTNELIIAAYPLVHQFAIAMYDALYVALALQLNYQFVTADRRLYDRISHLPIAVWTTDRRLHT